MDLRKRLGVELILVAHFATMVITVLISYILAVHYEHVYPYFPYISTTGQSPPESCIFSLGFNIATILGLIIVCIRYKHVCHIYSQSASSIRCLNGFSAALGVLSFSGILLVASFQDKGLFQPVHSIGAFACFFFGLMYMCFQTLISFKAYRSGLGGTGRCLLATRFILCIAALTNVCLDTVWIVLRQKHLCGGNESECKAFFILSTTGEWLMALFFMLFLLTFHWDFVGVALSVKVRTRHRNTTIIGNMLYDDDTSLTL